MKRTALFFFLAGTFIADADAQQLACLRTFVVSSNNIGLYNTCDQCMTATFGWCSSATLRRFNVPANDAIYIDPCIGTMTLLDETVCTGANQAPIARFSVSVSGRTVSFTDTSIDNDGTITSRAWTFGDGITSTQTNPSHTYATNGIYTVSLRVTDNNQATNTQSLPVSVIVLAASAEVPGGHGSANPPMRMLDYGTRATFALSPEPGYALSAIAGTCPIGNIQANLYTTGPVTSDCAVRITYSLLDRIFASGFGGSN